MRPPLAEQLDMLPHPEGGWYRETWRSAVSFEPAGYPGPRSAATAIYFLLHPGEASAWHVVRSDELWFWHAGGPLLLRLGGSGDRPATRDPGRADVTGPGPAPWPLPGGEGSLRAAAGGAGGPVTGAGGAGGAGGPVTGAGGAGGRVSELLLGADVAAGQRPQLLVPGGVWQSAAPAGDEPVLVSCVVAPGFDFADFRLDDPRPAG